MTLHFSRRLAVLSYALPIVAGAQSAGWNGAVEASGNILFGAASTRLLSVSAGASHADSSFEAQSDILFSYADALSDTDRRRRVTARAWRLSLGADLRPFDRVTRFVFASIDASLQQRVERRVAGGVGAKLTFYRHVDDDVSVSSAVLWEHTRASAADGDVAPVTTRARWSMRGRVRRQLASAVRFALVTFYQPAVDRLGRFTTEVNSSILLALNETLAFSTTVRDRYDSEARARGARSNHDGQLLFGIRASF